jgi:hypothetical protein
LPVPTQLIGRAAKVARVVRADHNPVPGAARRQLAKEAPQTRVKDVLRHRARDACLVLGSRHVRRPTARLSKARRRWTLLEQSGRGASRVPRRASGRMEPQSAPAVKRPVRRE